MTERLRYVINGIGIYVAEGSDAIWNAVITARLQDELDISLTELSEETVEQKLLIKPYSIFKDTPVTQGFVTPHHSVYDNGLLMYFSSLKMALKLEKDTLTLWIDKDFWPDFQYILQLLFARRNMVFVHAAGIIIDSKGILLPSFCGVGKTTFISEVVKIKRVQILGDDFILLDNTGNLHPYPRPLGLRYYHKSSFPEYYRTHNIKYRAEFNLWDRGIESIKYIHGGLLHTFFPRYHGGRAKYNLQLNQSSGSIYRLKQLLHTPGTITDDAKFVSLSLLMGKERIADKKAPLDSIYVLRWYRGIKDVKVTRTQDVNMVVNYCTGILFHEIYESLRINFNMLAVKGESPSAYYKSFEDVFQSTFRKSRNILLVDIPENMPAPALAKELVNLITTHE